MLPTEIPPDPPCSSKSLTVKADEKVSEKLVADPVVPEEIPTPKFCIRDYVLASRSKDIKASWPFMLKTLQLYVKHGIKDLLPPFEPPDLVKSQRPFVACSAAEQGRDDVLKEGDINSFNGQTASLGIGSCSSLEDLVLDCSDQGKNSSPEEQTSAIDQGSSLEKIHHPSFSDLEDNERGHTKFPEALEHKCRLVVRLGAISDTNRAEDKVSHSITGSDLMVSKVCPVCKTFSSTSNTTLNAHIDQCLSTESIADKVFNKFPKHKVKPRKKRLMADIYTTAPSCTLEDLDRRNGTNWAVELALQSPPNTEVVPNNKRPKLSQIEPTNEGSEGAVYVDSNGIKLRILSKFSGTQSPDDDSKLQKHTKEMNPDKGSLMTKRKHLSPKHTKNLKLKARRKTLRSFKLLNAKIPTTSEEDSGEENHQETDESQSQLLVSPNHVKKSISSSMRSLTSTYSDAPPKQVNEVSHATMKRMTSKTNMLGNSSRLDPPNLHSTRKQNKKFSDPDLVGSPKSKRVDSLNNATINTKRKSQDILLPNAKWSSESTSTVNGLMLRLARSSRSVSCSVTYSEDAVGMNDDSSDVAANLKDQNNMKSKGFLKRSYVHFGTNKGEATTEAFTVLKKIRRHRSNLRIAKRGFEVLPLTNGGAPGTFKDLGPKNDKQLGSCQSLFSDDINQELPSNSNDTQNIEGHEDYNIVKMAGRGNSNEQPPEAAECRGHDGIFNLGHCPKVSKEIDVCDSIANDNENTVNLKTTADTQFDPSPCIEEPGYSLSGSEEQLARSGDKENLHVDVYSNEISNRIREREDGYQHIEEKETSFNSHDDCNHDSTSAQDSGGCLTSHEDSGLDLPYNRSSSVTSVCHKENHDTNLRGENELSRSPVSTASTMSPLSPRQAKSNGTKIEILSRTTTLEGRPDLVAPAESKEETKRGFYGRNGDVNWNLPANDQTLNDQLCCCSCKESLSRDSLLSRQSVTAKTVQAKQVPSLIIGPRISSSFSAYQSQKTSAVPSANIRSSTPISSTGMHNAAYTSLCSPSTSSQSQNQSTSNPVLRLMGKNLMVVNSEEIVQTQTATLDQPPSLNTPAFGSTNNHFNKELHPYHHQFLSGHPASSTQVISDHPMPIQFPITTVGGFASSPYNCNWIKPDYQSQHKRQYERLNRSSPASYVMNDVIVIDDSPEHETELRGCLVSPNSLPFSASGLNHLPQRSFACFPSQSHSREIPGAGPMLQSAYPRIGASFGNHGNKQEGQVPHLPNPLVFQSPMTGQIGPSMYYQQTLL